MAWLFLLFVGLPFIELALLVRIGQSVGFWPTFAVTIAAGLAGATLAKSQGRKVFREWQQALSEGRVPEEGIASGLLVLVGAVLLISPGVLSDFIGLLFLLPQSRRVLARWLRAWIARRISDGRMRVFTFGEQAQQTSRERFQKPTGPIIDVRPSHD